jgi:hypothetical protein
VTAGSRKLGIPGITLTRTEEPTSCSRCGGEGLLSAQIPSRWPEARGAVMGGFRVIVLCPHCDANDPAGGALILFFAVHEQVSEETAREFASLLRSWVSQAQAPDVDRDALESELRAWRRGELDACEPESARTGWVDDYGADWPDPCSDDWP